jgi:transposase
VLLFLGDPRVPFTNNLAERALRMARLAQKIFGCARTLEGARRLVRIRSYIDTLRKQDRDILGELTSALKGTPRISDHV